MHCFSITLSILHYESFTMADLDNLDDAAEGEGECEEDDDDGEDDQQMGADTLALLASCQPSVLLSSHLITTYTVTEGSL